MTLKSALLVVAYLAISLAITAQGGYILASGRFFPLRGFVRRPLAQRALLGLLYIFGGVFLIGALAYEASRRRGLRFAMVAHWAVDNWGPLSLILIGILLLLRPAVGERWVRSAHPEAPMGDPRMRLIVRVIAGAMLAFGLFLVAVTIAGHGSG